MWDSYMQIKQFMGEAERVSSHPPFGTLVDGLLAWLGEAAGNRNLVYFVFTLLQCGACLLYTSEKIKAKARADVKHIVLPEGTEPRTVQALSLIHI